MTRKSALSHLQVILLIDIIVVALAATGYYYIQTLPEQAGPQPTPSPSGTNIEGTSEPSESASESPIPEGFQLSNFVLSSSSSFDGDPMSASINATNVGGAAGQLEVNLLIDTHKTDTVTVQLAASETKTVQFVFTLAEGTHSVEIGEFDGTVTVSSRFTLSNLAINRTEAGIGEGVGITAKITNRGQTDGTYQATLKINGAAAGTQQIQVGAGTVGTAQFAVTENAEGTYSVEIGNLSGSFKVVAAAPTPKPAAFDVSGLNIDPSVVSTGSPVKISVRITNTGETSASKSLDLSINDAVVDTKTVFVSGGETATMEFTVTENSAGTYRVTIAGLMGQFKVQAAQTASITGMIVKPYEVWPGQQITITVKVSNYGTDSNDVPLKLTVEGQVADTKTVTVAAGSTISVDFTITAAGEGTHSLNVNGFIGGYNVVKNGYHTLSINISPSGDAEFHLVLPDGTRETHRTYWTAVLPEGTYTIEMPWSDPNNAKVTFVNWDDGGANPVRTITLNKQVSVVATYTGSSSCPSLFIWNGTDFNYVQEISNHGWLGYTRYVNSDGSLEYWRNNPWDYIPLNKTQFQQDNGMYNILLSQKWDEIFFVDSAYLLVIDHPADINVYSTMVEQYLDPNFMGQIYTVSKNPLKPVSAYNEVVNVINGTVYDSNQKVDVLSQVSSTDGIFTSGFNGKYSEAWNNQTWNRLTLDLGNLKGAQQIKLVVRAKVDWGPAESYTLWMNKFYSTQVPDHTEPTPTPFMEVKDANGNWIRVPDSRQFPLPPDTLARTYIVDVTGLFPTDDYSLRINNFWNVTFDYIGIDTSSQQNITVHKIIPQANLYQEFVTPALSSGNFTRYGNVTELLLNEDDKFVIGRQGDAISLKFPADGLSAPADGMERDYYFFVACWFKVQYANYGFGPGNDGFTVTPLPFRTMSGFPYPLNSESFPFDADHLSYLQTWNTRVITQSANEQSGTAPNLAVTFLVIVIVLLLALNVSYAAFRFYSKHAHMQRKQTIP